ncbi:MAG TPA: C25 family cysteine peptidase [Pirellulaceae bacterium]|nr:C25 family cysteine peptidase [Pirellulaceae bacterium]
MIQIVSRKRFEMHRLVWVIGFVLLLAWERPVHAQESPVQLTIIVPREWKSELEEYVVRRGDDIRGIVVAWEDLNESQSGADEPERIKRFLYEQWGQGQVDHVLLVGDASQCPVRYMVLDRVTPAAFDYAFYASDLYYADLAKQDRSFEDWNGTKDDFHGQYYGEVRGEKNKHDPINFDQIDYLPEIGVGRWPVSNRDQLQIILEKSLEHQGRQEVTEPGAVETPNAALIAVGGWIDSRPHLDRIGQSLTGWRIEKRYFSDTQRDDGTQPPNAAEVAALFGLRQAVLFHAGHGHPDHWHDCISLRRLMRVETRGQWPIVLSAGCSTSVFAPQAPYEAYMDIHGVHHAGTNSGESFDRPPPAIAPLQPSELTYRSLGTELVVGTPHGAIAYFGCATGSQPCAMTLLEGFASALNSNPHHSQEIRLGDAYRQMIAHYVEAEGLEKLEPTGSWYPPSIFFQGMKFILFGDPTIRIGLPQP